MTTPPTPTAELTTLDAMSELTPAAPASITFGVARDEPWAQQLDTTDLTTPDPDLAAAFGW